MDAKITKKRLGHMLSYDWIKIVAIITAVIVFWWLIFSVAATKITPAQEFSIFNYTRTYSGERYSSLVTGVKKDGALSYDVLKVNAYDVTGSKAEADTVLSARLQTEEGDILFVANSAEGVDEKSTQYPTDTEETYVPTYLQQFLTSYYYGVPDLVEEETGLLPRMNAYLSPFYHGDLENGELDEAAVKTAFFARIKKLKDKRFKTDKEKKKGFEQELVRVEKLRESYLKFHKYLEEDVIRLEETFYYVKYYDGRVVKRTGKYAVNLSPDKENEKLRSVAYYYKTETDEEGLTHYVKTTENMCAVLLDVVGEKYDYSVFETVSFICYLVEHYVK